MKIHSLNVPEIAQVHESVSLFCDYDLKGQNLHNIKWFKGRHEFFRYSPGDHIKKKIFLIRNLDVDVSIIRINDGYVALTSTMLLVL